MPFVVLYIKEGRSEEQKIGLVKDITVAMGKHLRIDEASVQIIFHELREDQIGVGGWLETTPEYKAKKALAGSK